MKDKKIIFGITLAFIFLASVGFSYAYFSNAITNKDVKDQVVETGTLQLTYTDGPEINIQNMKPGNTINKTITVKNTGSLEAKYNIIWQKLINEITNDEMLIEGTCTSSNGTCESIVSTPISSKTIKKGISIAPGVTHTYNLTITFKDTESSQNYNQGKKFSGVLGVDEYKIPEPEKFSTDSWDTIANAVKNNNISKYNVGDTKEVDLGDLGKHNVRIANTTTPNECVTEGFSQTACGFVLEFVDIITIHLMNNSDTNAGGWPATSMRTFANEYIYNAMPSHLRNIIIDTLTVSANGSKDGKTTNFTSTDKLYLLTPKEIYADWSSTAETASNLTRQLDYYKNLGTNTSNYSGVIKKSGTIASNWWLRAAHPLSPLSFYFVGIDGKYGSGDASYDKGVSPAFRIG